MIKILPKWKTNLILVFSLFLSLLAFSQTPPDDLEGEALKAWYRTNYYDGKHQTLGYTSARVYLYNYIDNDNGVITCVYSGYQVNSPYGGTTTYPAPINCEHTIPQSFFSEAEPMKSDIHHLYPTYENWNSTRSNYPFAEIDDNITAKWMYLDQSQTTIPSSNIDLYSEYANSTFEPREDHKGNVARSIFYFYTMYPTEAGDLSLVGDIDMFYQWHLDDPVDADEIARNDKVETYQGNRNPYIDYPETVARAWGFTNPDNPPATTTLQISTGSTSLTLSWTDVSNEDGYELYKSTDGTNFTLLSDLSANTTDYDDNAVSVGITYYYYILAYNTYGNSSNSNTVSGQLNSGGSGTTTELLFSEYIEGSSYNKGLEIANFTGVDVDLSNYSIKKQTNGAGDWGSELVLSGTLTNEDVYVIVNSSAAAEMLAVADLQTGAGAVTFNGNDALGLFKNGTLIDMLGVFDSASDYAKDVTLVRNSDVLSPNTTYTTSEWTSYPTNTFTYLGSHSVDGGTSDTEAPTAPAGLVSSNVTETSVDLSWNASTDNVGVTGYDLYQDGSFLVTTTVTNYAVAGLTASTTYEFFVKAKDAAGNFSPAGNSINVTTLTPTDTESPTAPTGLAYSNVTETSVDLSWNASTDNVGVTGYDLYQDGTYLTTTTSTNYSVTGLTASTTYEFFVKAKDAAGNISSASNTVNVTTSDIVLTYCTSQGENSTYEWIADIEIGSYSNSSGAADYSDFTSEIISLEKGSTIDITLTPGFSSSTYNEYWKIWIDYNIDGDFDDAEELVFDAGSLSSSAVTGDITIPLTASGSTRMRVSMKYNSEQTACETFAYGEVEDYTVTFTDPVIDTEAPSVPTALAASDITSDGVTISWSASTDNVGVTEYEVYQDGLLTGSTANTNYSVSGLSASTTYAFTVKAKDAAGNVSAASSALNVTTSDIQLTYCESTGNSVYYEWIDLVEIGSISNSTGSNGGYADFTNLSTSVTPGENVSINVSCGFRSTSYTEYWHVWIDWNQDGTFDSNEEMATGSSSSSGTLTYNFTVPGDAMYGSTRMRVTMKYAGSASPCETFSYGEVEDYTIDIVIASSATALQENIVSNVKTKLYPNPAKDYTTLELITEDNSQVSYKVIDIQGRIHMAKDHIHVNGYLEERIDVSALKPGVYFIIVTNELANENHKLIIQ